MAVLGLPELFPRFCGRKGCQLSSVRGATSTEIGDFNVFVALGKACVSNVSFPLWLHNK